MYTVQCAMQSTHRDGFLLPVYASPPLFFYFIFFRLFLFLCFFWGVVLTVRASAWRHCIQPFLFLLYMQDVKRTGNKVGYFQIHPVRAIVLDVCSKASIAAAVKHFETKQNEAASASASASAVTPKDTGSSGSSSGSGRSESSSNSSSTTNGKKKEEVVDAGLVDTGRLDILINNAGVMVQEEKPGAAPITVATNVTALIAVSNVRTKQAMRCLFYAYREALHPFLKPIADVCLLMASCIV